MSGWRPPGSRGRGRSDTGGGLNSRHSPPRCFWFVFSTTYLTSCACVRVLRQARWLWKNNLSGFNLLPSLLPPSSSPLPLLCVPLRGWEFASPGNSVPCLRSPCCFGTGRVTWQLFEPPSFIYRVKLRAPSTKGLRTHKRSHVAWRPGRFFHSCWKVSSAIYMKPQARQSTNPFGL